MVELKSTILFLWHTAFSYLLFCILCQSASFASSPADFNLHNLPMPTQLAFTRVKLSNNKANKTSTHQEKDTTYGNTTDETLGEAKFLLDFGKISIADIGCGKSNTAKCLNCKKQPDSKTVCENCYKKVWEEACLNPSTAHLYQGCNRQNTVVMFICYASQYDGQSGLVRPQFYMENMADSTIAKVCKQLDNSGLLDKSDKNNGIHGMALGICVEKDLEKSKFMAHIQMQTSYSAKIYNSTMEVTASQEVLDHKKINPSLAFGVAAADDGDCEHEYTQFRLDKKKPINSKEQIPSLLVLPLQPAAYGNEIEQNALAFSFMDMLVHTEGNSNLRNLYFAYSTEEEEHACSTFSQILLDDGNETHIELDGCKRGRKRSTCEKKFGADCERMKWYKKCICATMWLCEQKPPQPIPPDLQHRFEVPAWLEEQINKSANERDELEPGGNDPEIQARKKFNQETRCGNPNSWLFPREDAIPLDLKTAAYEIKRWEKKCGGHAIECDNSPLSITRMKRSSAKEWRWKNPIVYKFSDELMNKTKFVSTQNMIQEAIISIETLTCLHFENDQDVGDDIDHMFFDVTELFDTKDAECVSNGGIGRRGGQHEILFDTHMVGHAAHEIGHALGLLHEMARDDRDKYIYPYPYASKSDASTVTIWGLPPESIVGYGTPYDYSSMMHYLIIMRDGQLGSQKYYSYITYLRAYQSSLGADVQGSLSYRDARVLNLYYCADPEFQDICKNNPTLECKRDGYQDPRDCSKCRCPRGFAGKQCEKLEENDIKKCKSSLGSFEIKPKMGVTKLIGSINSNGSCYWLIEPFSSDGRPLTLKGITIHRVEGLTYCAAVLEEQWNCGSPDWVFPCVDHLRIQFQPNKTESGARVCCPQQLPLTITSDEFKNPKSDDNIFPLKLGEILLELKVANFPEGQKEISFELEIFAEEDISSTTEMVPIELEYSCDCESTEKLVKTGRNPNIEQNVWKRSDAVQRCKSGEEKHLMVIFGCNINNYREDARETIVFKFNEVDLSQIAPIIDMLGSRALAFKIICLKGVGPTDTKPFWSPAESQAFEHNWLVQGVGDNWTITKLEETKWPVTRIDEILCFNKTSGGK